MSSNDPFVLKEFANDLQMENKMDLIADGGLYLTRELDAQIDLTE